MADLVLLNLEKADQPIQSNINGATFIDSSIYSSIVYSASKENVKLVLIDGEIVVKDGRCFKYDEEGIIADGKVELSGILKT
jgi:cytosine/adenosine deaminase-related metal-dependent hydrolase